MNQFVVKKINLKLLLEVLVVKLRAMSHVVKMSISPWVSWHESLGCPSCHHLPFSEGGGSLF